MVKVQIELPERDSYGELMKAYLTLLRLFGTDLASTCLTALNPVLGNWWFQKLVDDRRLQGKLQGHKHDLVDPTIVLKEIAHEQVSPIHEVLPPSAATSTAAKKIVQDRNSLLHFGVEPSLDDVADAVHRVQLFARSYGLATDGAIVPLLSRLSRIKRGRYVHAVHPGVSEHRPPTVQPAPVTQTEPAARAESAGEEAEAAVEITGDLPRPKIGGVWAGDVPLATYKVTKTTDIIDTATGDSIQGRVAGDFPARARQWLAPGPKGDLWISEDGAVGGYVQAVPRLLGYIGEEPPGEFARGFLLPRYYETTGTAVVDIDSGDLIVSPLAASVSEGTLLRVTTYGDVLIIDDDHGVQRVGTVAPSEWFPGHLV